jgi:putative peptidoglycan lipid II flippase
LLVERVAGTLAGLTGLLVFVAVLASPALVLVFAPGFWADPLKFELTAYMLRFTFPYLLFMALVAFAAGILNSYGRFGAAAFTPVWLNVVLIAMALLVAPRLDEPMLALAWGVLVAGVVQLLFLLPALARLRLLPRPRWGLGDPGVGSILKLMLPAVVGSSVSQINLLFDTLLASFLVTGSVSWLYYADRLVEFPLGVFGIALATVILPTLSKAHTQGASQQFSHTLDAGLRWVLLIGVPAAAGLMMLARPVLSTLFQYDDFAQHDIDMAALALISYAFGLPAFMLVKVLAPAFYARQDARTPVKIAVRAMIANMVMNVLIVVPLVVFEIPGAHAGLALATALAGYLNAGLLFHYLHAEAIYRPAPGWPRLLLQILFAIAVMLAALIGTMPDPPVWAALSGSQRVLWTGSLVALGAASYLASLRLAGLRLSVLRTPGAAAERES